MLSRSAASLIVRCPVRRRSISRRGLAAHRLIRPTSSSTGFSAVLFRRCRVGVLADQQLQEIYPIRLICYASLSVIFFRHE